MELHACLQNWGQEIASFAKSDVDTIWVPHDQLCYSCLIILSYFKTSVRNQVK